MTEMQVHEERVMNLVKSSSDNPTITRSQKQMRTVQNPSDGSERTKMRSPSISAKSKGMYMYIHTYTENGEEKGSTCF